MADPEDLVTSTEDARRALMKIRGVRAVGIGSKLVGGEPTDQVSLQVLVAVKRPLAELSAEEVIPAEVAGLPTDVIEVGDLYIDAEPNTKECLKEDTSNGRPLEGGIQIEPLHGWTDTATGTLGCFAKTTDTNQVVMLSNAHVLADKDGHVGDRVGQPGMCSVCSACCSDPVGKVLRFKKTPHVDGAIATLDPGVAHAAQIKEIGAVAGTRAITAADALAGTIKVQKRGRTTGHTFGTVIGWVPGPADIKNHNGSVYRVATDFLTVIPRTPSKCWSLGGDSGSAVLDENRMVLGLHFGGSGTGKVGSVCPIQFVTQELEIEILTADAPVPVRRQDVTLPVLAEVVGAGALAETPGGRVADDLYRRHGPELRVLVRSNRRVAAMWRRHGGPELLHALMRAVEAPATYRLPDQLEGRPFRDQIELICRMIARYASAELRSALQEHGPTLAAVGGATLAEAGDLLAPPDRGA